MLGPANRGALERERLQAWSEEKHSTLLICLLILSESSQWWVFILASPEIFFNLSLFFFFFCITRKSFNIPFRGTNTSQEHLLLRGLSFSSARTFLWIPTASPATSTSLFSEIYSPAPWESPAPNLQISTRSTLSLCSYSPGVRHTSYCYSLWVISVFSFCFGALWCLLNQSPVLNSVEITSMVSFLLTRSLVINILSNESEGVGNGDWPTLLEAYSFL